MSRAAIERRGRQRGIALAAAVFALVALAALLAGLWFAALQEFRVGANVVSDRRAFDAAEAGLDEALAGWNTRAFNRLAVNETAAFSGAIGGGAATYAGVVRRLGPWLFLVRSTGSDARGSSRRTLAAVARLSPLRLGIEAALVARGPVHLGAGAFVDGLAADADGSCASAVPAAGIVVGDGTRLDMSGCPAGDCVRGSPASMVDEGLEAAPVPLLGEAGWASLVAAAETIGPSGLAPSGAHVWFAPGDLSLPAGALAGPVVLLVQGDLVVETGAQLTGLVVVRGKFIVRGAGGSLLGSVLAGEVELSALGGSRAVVSHSSCAVESALAAAAPPRRLRERSWTALYPDAP